MAGSHLVNGNDDECPNCGCIMACCEGTCHEEGATRSTEDVTVSREQHESAMREALRGWGESR